MKYLWKGILCLLVEPEVTGIIKTSYKYNEFSLTEPIFFFKTAGT